MSPAVSFSNPLNTSAYMHIVFVQYVRCVCVCDCGVPIGSRITAYTHSQPNSRAKYDAVVLTFRRLAVGGLNKTVNNAGPCCRWPANDLRTVYGIPATAGWTRSKYGDKCVLLALDHYRTIIIRGNVCGRAPNGQFNDFMDTIKPYLSHFSGQRMHA